MSARGHQSRNWSGFRLVTRSDELEELRDEWRALLAQSFSAEPMLDPDWLLTWWRHYGEKRELAVGLFYENGCLVGLAPLCRRRYRYFPGMTYRRLEFLGAGFDEQDGVGSDYLCLIAKPESHTRVCDAFVRRLADGSFGSWDECLLQMMDGSHPVSAGIRASLTQSQLAFEEASNAQSPYMTLPQSWESYLAGLSKKRRQSLHYALRDFKEWAEACPGGWRVERANDDETLRRALHAVGALHTARWRSEGVTGAFSSKRFVEFHNEYACKMLAEGRLELAWLSVAGQPVAGIYCFHANGKVYFYQSGRVMNVPSKVRLGIVMLILTLQEAIRKGAREFDFLGGEAQYKRLFATGSRDLIGFRVARPSARETLLKTLKTFRNTLRALRARMDATRSQSEA